MSHTNKKLIKPLNINTNDYIRLGTKPKSKSLEEIGKDKVSFASDLASLANASEVVSWLLNGLDIISDPSKDNIIQNINEYALDKLPSPMDEAFSLFYYPEKWRLKLLNDGAGKIAKPNPAINQTDAIKSSYKILPKFTQKKLYPTFKLK